MELMNNMKIVLDDILKGKSSVALGGHIRPEETEKGKRQREERMNR